MELEKTMVPENESGVQTNTEASAVWDTEEEARRFFEVVKQRLLQVNNWHQVAGGLSAVFQLTDGNGVDVNRTPQKGDHFKIDIPGPGPATGNGYDWVRIEAIEESEPGQECMVIRVRPAMNPNSGNKEVAHFFSDEATSSFVAKRKGKEVIAAVYGRNEKPNTHMQTLADTTRNTAVATGAITGFSKLQWKSLVNGLVKKE